MPENPNTEIDLNDELDESDRKVAEAERESLRQFVKTLSPDEIKSGGWFTRLISQALGAYTEKATWQYFQQKYEGAPADIIVDQRIKMAARYAALEGGLSAGAYTAAVAATIGSLGGASPLTVPAAVATLMVDVTYITQLQIRLAHDIAVLYRVPVDTADPDDLWKLIRVAFTIKGGELLRDGMIKAVPFVVRPLIKKYFSGAVLATAKSLPIVGKFILQRNIIKIAIPGVGVPLAIGLNHWTTGIAGKHARAVFRNEARVIELARKLSEETRHPQLLLWVAWLVITADRKTSDDEALLIRYLFRLVSDTHGVVDEQLARVVDIDPDNVWRLIETEVGDLSDIVDAAYLVAAVDGDPNAREVTLIAEIRQRCERS